MSNEFEVEVLCRHDKEDTNILSPVVFCFSSSEPANHVHHCIDSSSSLPLWLGAIVAPPREGNERYFADLKSSHDSRLTWLIANAPETGAFILPCRYDDAVKYAIYPFAQQHWKRIVVARSLDV